jgi:peroxiredoxin Q/BCP
MANTKKIKIGDIAPDFELPDQNGKIHKLSNYRGKWVLVYFYPKDNTPGCTTEACTFRDNFSFFKKLNCQILGISTDSVKSHQKFAEKYQLPFPILADEKKEVVKKYGVYGEKKFLGKIFMGTKRTSFLIDPEGKIVKIYEKVNPKTHLNEVINDLENKK